MWELEFKRDGLTIKKEIGWKKRRCIRSGWKLRKFQNNWSFILHIRAAGNTEWMGYPEKVVIGRAEENNWYWRKEESLRKKGGNSSVSRIS